MAHFCPLRVNSHFISNLLRLLFDEAKWKCGNMRAKEEQCVHIAIATSNRNQTNNTHTRINSYTVLNGSNVHHSIHISFLPIFFLSLVILIPFVYRNAVTGDAVAVNWLSFNIPVFFSRFFTFLCSWMGRPDTYAGIEWIERAYVRMKSIQ